MWQALWITAWDSLGLERWLAAGILEDNMLIANMLGCLQGRRSARKGPKSLPTAPQRIRRPRSTSSSRCPHAVQPERQSTAILRIAAATKKTAASARSARSCGPPLQTPSTDTVACSPDSEQSQKSQSGVFPVPASITGAIRLKLRQDRDYVHQVGIHVSMLGKPIGATVRSLVAVAGCRSLLAASGSVACWQALLTRPAHPRHSNTTHGSACCITTAWTGSGSSIILTNAKTLKQHRSVTAQRRSPFV